MIIPVHAPSPPPTQTRRSRELGRLVERAIRDYQRDHPDLTDDEIRAALAQASVGGDDHGAGLRQRRVVAAALGVAAAVAGAVFAAVSGSGSRVAGGGGGLAWAIVAGTVAVCAVLVALVVASRR